MDKNIEEIQIPFGEDGDFVVVADVSQDEVGCLIEALECEDIGDVDDIPFYHVPKVGRPRKFESVEDLIERAQKYFDECMNVPLLWQRPLTITGLCNALGTFRNVLIDYEKGKYGEEYKEVIKFLKQIVEQGYEERLHGPNATGAIFGLKNFGWQDTHAIGGIPGQPIVTRNERSEDLKDYTKEELKKILETMPE